ncbi:ATP-binding protein [Streptomyces sp. NPDC005271]|uniref:ATP-binding protein n=1 Tax=unclassified Streptomyces TaxID=2593676 RepID=UPI0033A45F38
MTVMAEAGTKQYQQQLTVDPKCIGRIRRAVTAQVRLWGWGEYVDPAVRCVTEMLSNVYRHADSDECVLLLQVSPSRVRIVVSDDSPKLPVVCEPDWESESGRGVFILSTTADAWGADPTDNGKDVWVEFRADGAAV